MKIKENVMVDLETLGTRAGCSILSIGAVKFDAEGLGEEFYVVVSRENCIIMGLIEDPDTINWWSKQAPEARTVLDEAAKPEAKTLEEALNMFTKWLANEKVWGNGSDFDNAILYACYAAIGQETPWKFWDSRCYRTLKALYPTIKMVRGGTYHNALDDAKSQANHAVEIFKKR
jgi:DNA polymerase III epsilon subunit-like protein